MPLTWVSWSKQTSASESSASAANQRTAPAGPPVPALLGGRSPSMSWHRTYLSHLESFSGGAGSDDKLAASNAELERLQKQWQIRRSVWELMGKIEESPKKEPARAIFEKSGLAEAIPVPPVGGLAAGEPGTEEWVLKLVWLLRTVNFAVPYSAVGEFFGQPKEDSEKAVTSFAETFDWGAADIEKALRSFLEAFLLPKEGT
ncbi:BIG2 [Symbiodinium sp. CCMP2592]|nr:BIG2 [Symbiodinium sp. CCMP2592]